MAAGGLLESILHPESGPDGATLFTAYQRFDFDFVLAILIVIVALIMAAEIVSGWARRVFQ